MKPISEMSEKELREMKRSLKAINFGARYGSSPLDEEQRQLFKLESEITVELIKRRTKEEKTNV